MVWRSRPVWTSSPEDLSPPAWVPSPAYTCAKVELPSSVPRVRSGRPAIDHGVQQRSQGPQIRRGIDRLTADLFRRSVRGCGRPQGPGRSGQSEPRDHDPAVRLDEDLVGTEVAVCDAQAVRGREYIEYLQADADRPGLVERPTPVEEFAQGPAFDRFHDGPQAAVLLGDVEDGGHPAGGGGLQVRGLPQHPGRGLPGRLLAENRGQPCFRKEHQSAGRHVLAVPADPEFLSVHDLERSIPPGDQLVCGGLRFCHADPSLRPWVAPWP